MQNIYHEYVNSAGVCTDTRQIQPGCIFFALKGELFDGNQFVDEALKKGAKLAVIDDPDQQVDGKTILVNDVLKTLQALAKYHRGQLSIPVIALTGSNGKTTTKELIASVLRTKFCVFATEGNLNNHIGVPLSILSIEKKHEIAIIEMGANHLNEIQFLSEIAQPDHGLITNIGKAHLEGFGGIAGVTKGKKELYDYLSKSKGIVFLNSADPKLNEIKPDTTIYQYGGNAQVTGNINSQSELLKIEIKIGHKNTLVQTNLVGGYNLSNVLAAVCIGTHFKIDQKDICNGLEAYIPSNHRSQFIETEHNNVVLDAYNSNPSSVEAALENFAKRKEENKLVILGDMLELGRDSRSEHANAIQLLKTLGLDSILVGSHFGLEDQDLFPCFENAEQTLTYLKNNAVKGRTILIKGSRGIKLETVLSAL